MENDRVRELVEGFAEKLEELVRSEIRRGFEAALGGTGTQARGAPRPAALAAPKPAVDPRFARPGRRKGEKRTPAQLAAVKDALLAYVRKHPGERIEPIAAGLSIPTHDLSRPMKKLIAEKLVKFTGEKRATRYFPA